MGNSFALSRTLYMYGFLEGQGLLKQARDLDEIEQICIQVANDWKNRVDIQSEEEEGYPSAYASRVLLEKHGI